MGGAGSLAAGWLATGSPGAAGPLLSGRRPLKLLFFGIPRAKRTTALLPLGFDIAEEGLNYFISNLRGRRKLCVSLCF